MSALIYDDFEHIRFSPYLSVPYLCKNYSSSSICSSSSSSVLRVVQLILQSLNSGPCNVLPVLFGEIRCEDVQVVLCPRCAECLALEHSKRWVQTASPWFGSERASDSLNSTTFCVWSSAGHTKAFTLESVGPRQYRFSQLAILVSHVCTKRNIRQSQGQNAVNSDR